MKLIAWSEGIQCGQYERDISVIHLAIVVHIKFFHLVIGLIQSLNDIECQSEYFIITHDTIVICVRYRLDTVC